ncbi:MAG: RNA polymerase sporulation sigma factor SigK [Clostridia bacterium]|nr:RNA polymerase sporulation sigma factor SigK [Clostridia bacterium]MBQ6708993.1 RNA polymerase sporulation sigma factor SigK [Clostridia bacterium]
MFGELLRTICENLLYFALHLSNSGSFPPPLSAEKERECFEKWKSGDTSAKDELIEHNLRLVAHVIKKYSSNFSEQDDLISIGTIGLIKAINTFNCEKGTRLATYAARCIENEILMHFRSQKKIAQDVSISEPIDIDSEGNPLTLMDIIYCEDTIADDIDLKMKSEYLRKFISEMKDEREKQIIILRYGMNGRRPLTQREVAKKLDISRSYVSRLEKKALESMRRKFTQELKI